MPDNPYVDSASGFASSAMHAAGALAAALSQQQELQQRQRQQLLKDQFDQEVSLRQKGYTPLMQTTGQTSSGLKTRESQQVPSDRVITDPYGRQWVTPAPKPDATAQQGYSDLQTALSKGAEPLNSRGDVWEMSTVPRLQMEPSGTVSDTGKTGVHVAPPDESRVFSVPGTGKQVYIPTSDEQAQSDLQHKLAATSAIQGAEGMTLPDSLASALEQRAGLPAGSMKGLNIPKEGVGTVITHLTEPQKDKYSYNHFTDDKGNVNLTRIGSGDNATPERFDAASGKWMPLEANNRLGAKPPKDQFSTTADDLKETARAIKAGEATPILSNYSFRDRTAIAAELHRMGYNQAQAEQDYKAVQKHLATLNGSQQERLRQSITSASEMLPVIRDLYQNWKKYGGPSGVKVFNKAALAASKNLPGNAGKYAHLLESQISDLTSDMGSVYMGGNTPTDHSLALAAKNLNGDWNEDTFNSALDQIDTNIRIRKNSMATSMAQGISPNSPYQQPATVKLVAPDGKTVKDVPADQVDYYLSKGAKRAGQ